MNYISEFENPENIHPLLKQLEKSVEKGREYRIMEFCGGHTHTFFQSGLIDLLPKNIKMIHGPGCPVCVLPSTRIAMIIDFLESRKDKDVLVCTYADLLRIPCDKGQPFEGQGKGSQYPSDLFPLDALNLARKNRDQKIIFMAMGFETTTPPTVLALKTAIEEKLNNFFIYCNHVKTAPALEGILSSSQSAPVKLDGIIGPGHVASVTGAEFFKEYARKEKIPIVIAGFTPFDLAQSLCKLVEQVNEKRFDVEIEYKRVVSFKGNEVAQELMKKFLVERESFEWRGLGELPLSAYKIRDEYSSFDAEKKFDFKKKESFNHPGCLCPKVLTGQANPLDCKLFATVCSPENPLGACMVSSEGACAAYFRAGRHL